MKKVVPKKKVKSRKVLRKVVKIFLVFLYLLLLSISFILIFGTNWAISNYGFDSFNQILYTLNSSVTKAGDGVVEDFISSNVIIPVCLILGIYIIYRIIKYIFRNSNFIWDIEVFHKKISNIKLKKIGKVIFTIFPIFLLIFSICYTMSRLYIFDYLISSSKTSDFIKLEYVDPEDVKITFPNKKRNLIYIYLESMENTYANEANGGYFNINYIPELTKLAKENLNFSYTKKIGGAVPLYGTTWTTGAIVASTAGVPIKTSLDANSSEFYDSGVVEKAYSLGDILKDNGYQNYMMVGSDIEFGGREAYLASHGNYTMLDYNTAIDEGVIDEDYYVWWGLEDYKLFNWAKDKLTEIASDDEPFNFTMLTVDTHAVGGYTSNLCEKKYNDSYFNSIACSSSQLGEFIDWIQKQDFYKNTTVILTGDHLSMNKNTFTDVDDDYMRTVYNVYLNPAIQTDCNKNREFSTFDFFPTTLASLGATINGNKLGLGTNLFSCKKTLSEIYGNKYINKNLPQKSTFYNKHIA